MATPYVSVAFTNRNDGYGGDLEARIAKFIEYYAWHAGRHPGLFEFVICDWNPPAGRPRLRDAFDWSPLGPVLHVEVPPEIHAQVAGERGRKILDYVGRNVAIRRGRGKFSLVLNQDIFISRSIIDHIARRSLSERYFYRADRCDFDFEPCRNVAAPQFEQVALDNVFVVHRRHRADDQPISVEVDALSLHQQGTRVEEGDRFDREAGIIYSDGALAQLMADRPPAGLRRLIWRKDEARRASDEYRADSYHRQFLLHTNASGDFVLAPRAAFDKIHGMVETTDFYMHLDTYALIQLFAAGYGQAIFSQPHRVFHADHSREGRSDYQEQISWPQHETRLSGILRGEQSFRLNPADWGLASRNLPTFGSAH